jgi:DNA-binding LytR/AlgR family response regulator
MINVLIIEDEAPARRKLQRLIHNLDQDIYIIAESETVNDAIQILQQPHSIDLIFSDISLRDGNAFLIYERVAKVPPVIFITAYNEYLMEAFETNGIGYLLKPYTATQFKNAWDKFLGLRAKHSDPQVLFSQLNSLVQGANKKVYKKRFTCNAGKGIFFLDTQHIAYFLAEESVVFAIDHSNQKHLLTINSLKEVQQLIDPLHFCQINRAEIVNRDFVERLERYGKNNILIGLKQISDKLITSQSRTAMFREWLDQ